MTLTIVNIGAEIARRTTSDADPFPQLGIELGAEGGDDLSRLLLGEPTEQKRLIGERETGREITTVAPAATRDVMSRSSAVLTTQGMAASPSRANFRMRSTAAWRSKVTTTSLAFARPAVARIR